ncbi:MAG: RAMP superfamily CRISPR-associated protein, partial [Cetobacterium sp.]
MIIKYNVILETPAMTGKDGVIGKDIDLITKLDKEGLPYFSASGIKGILKEKVVLFSSALNTEFPIDKYFGKEGKVESSMRFSSLTVDKKKYSEYKDFLIFDRSGIRIDRESRTTAEGSLFSYEFIREGLEFNGEIEIFDELKSDELKLLKASLERIDFIGGLKSRGIGKVRVKIIETLQDKTQNNKKLELGAFKKYSYTLKPLENLVLKNVEIGNEITTNTYIHGSTLRGTLISELNKNYTVEVETLIEKLKVSQGLPKESFVSPASIFESKYNLENGEKIRVNKLLSKNIENTIDGEEVKFERYGAPIVDKNFEKIKLQKETEINIAIDMNSKTSEEGKLFNKEILLVKDTEFTGTIELTEEIVKAMFGKNIYLGKSRSKGFGKCYITFEPLNDEKEKVSLNKLERLSKEVGLDKKYFTIDFISDTILPFLDTTSIGELIKGILSLENVKWEESKSFVDIISIGGYNQLNKIRKASEYAISKGGVLTFSIEEFSDDLIQRLDSIQLKGIGARKNEGFGD